MHLCTISVDRYLSLRYPMKFGRNKTKKRVTLKISLVWFFSITISLPLSLMYSKVGDRDDHDPCLQLSIAANCEKVSSNRILSLSLSLSPFPQSSLQLSRFSSLRSPSRQRQLLIGQIVSVFAYVSLFTAKHKSPPLSLSLPRVSVLLSGKSDL